MPTVPDTMRRRSTTLGCGSTLANRAILIAATTLIAGSTHEAGRVLHAQDSTCLGVINNGCITSVVVPCQAATCVSWTTAYPGSTVPACPDGSNRNGASFDCTVTSTQWTVCDSKGPRVENSCTNKLTVCGTYKFYTDSTCTVTCGTQTRGYCKGASNTPCPVITPPPPPGG